ncbi:Nitrilase/cyanide hydratase and apolipoprotein N-acyltransferase family protein [Melia azedarach]|uniref:Nitrilase/cyanide hydratase and apolipoprotein N-acyltransferase family protein n=1 Tax=Melia azedarach TaxID=155640 RepID=A0ACC1Y268_MELAZ|nr:Nitrilase/cyanide hydratase and apolipoprotein N-acyltransferase family protein [Melia azedarach]
MEMSNCPYSNDYFAKCAEDFEDKTASPSFTMLPEIASCCGITVVGGSIPELNNGQLYNTCCVFGPDGKLKAKHRKGDISFKESDFFTAGNKPTIVDTDIGRIAVGICHDIRFPELAMLYREKGADMICYPGAFNMSTGELLWELMQRARKVYLVVCGVS